ncbi:hypothetical protein MRB53_023863 [Persea americana]|uniref:Uncharacterized protein n=1 Tax=Persea americana TaxID=3435 RepID=A0ACC2LAR5_PERAE|nr:hypothetical protein MRB53_023863 [Persea americana]
MWDARVDVIVQGQKDASPTHTDEYFKWYIPNTRMHIGHHWREPNSEDGRKAKPNVPQQEASPSQGAGPSNDHVNIFLDTLEKSVDRAVRKKNNHEKFVGKLHKKIKTFRGAFATTLENFSMEKCSSSSSDLDMEKVPLGMPVVNALSRQKAMLDNIPSQSEYKLKQRINGGENELHFLYRKDMEAI